MKPVQWIGVAVIGYGLFLMYENHKSVPVGPMTTSQTYAPWAAIVLGAVLIFAHKFLHK